MPNRWQTADYEQIKGKLAYAEGNYCLACKIEKHVQRGPPAIKLQIDHANADPLDRGWDNLHLLCQTHNLNFRKLPPATHRRLMDEYSAKNERERERQNLTTRKNLIMVEAEYQNGSSEMKARSKFEVRWLNYIHQHLDAEGSITKDQAIKGGAAYAGCAKQTATNYYEVHSWGRFKEGFDNDGNKILVYRDAKICLTKTSLPGHATSADAGSSGSAPPGARPNGSAGAVTPSRRMESSTGNTKSKREN